MSESVGASLPRRFPRLLIRADGAARGNPGPASAGAVIIDASVPGADHPDAPPLAVVARPLGRQTNNYAEYSAVLFALEEARRLGGEEVELVLDSKLIVEQLTGRWKIKNAGLLPLVSQVQALLRGFRRWSARHEPRARNRAADALANLALDDPRAAAEMERRYRAVPGGGDSLPAGGGAPSPAVGIASSRAGGSTSSPVGGLAPATARPFPALPRTWAEFAAEAPALSAVGERLLRAFTVGYLATVRDDGAPRVHPVSVTLHEGGLYIFVLAGSPKLRDLLDNGHFALHSFPVLPAEDAWDDEEFSVGGRARRVDDGAERASVAAVHSDDVAPGDQLFELRVERAHHKARQAGRAVYSTWTVQPISERGR